MQVLNKCHIKGSVTHGLGIINKLIIFYTLFLSPIDDNTKNGYTEKMKRQEDNRQKDNGTCQSELHFLRSFIFWDFVWFQP